MATDSRVPARGEREAHPDRHVEATAIEAGDALGHPEAGTFGVVEERSDSR